mmetsp:Transcript_3011/g.7229  ORF Transcript_3011/g.7229 Transcript_3011/m.7229 type:complete len:306 (-) Transcript_3011:2057-2974(-)
MLLYVTVLVPCTVRKRKIMMNNDGDDERTSSCNFLQIPVALDGRSFVARIVCAKHNSRHSWDARILFRPPASVLFVAVVRQSFSTGRIDHGHGHRDAAAHRRCVSQPRQHPHRRRARNGGSGERGKLHHPRRTRALSAVPGLRGPAAVRTLRSHGRVVPRSDRPRRFGHAASEPTTKHRDRRLRRVQRSAGARRAISSRRRSGTLRRSPAAGVLFFRVRGRPALDSGAEGLDPGASGRPFRSHTRHMLWAPAVCPLLLGCVEQRLDERSGGWRKGRPVPGGCPGRTKDHRADGSRKSLLVRGVGQ